MKIALVILTRNELPSLKEMLLRIPRPSVSAGFDLIRAVDGGSTDGTVEYFEAHGIPVIAQSTKGRGQAFRQAFNEIDADAYIFFSPDGNEDAADLHRFRPLLEGGADLVIASRMMPGARNEEDDLVFKARKWANQAFNLMANVAFRREGSYVTDSINGYRAITREAASRLGLDASDYTIEYQMTMRAMKHGMNIVEFPTIEGARIAGETQAHSIPTGIRFVKVFFRELSSTSAARTS